MLWDCLVIISFRLFKNVAQATGLHWFHNVIWHHTVSFSFTTLKWPIHSATQKKPVNRASLDYLKLPSIFLAKIKISNGLNNSALFEAHLLDW